MATQASHPFTCNTCQVAFRSSDLQRSHMQSDWHRYNLKRRVASLPPLSSEIFAEKVLANKASAAATAARASYEKSCDACNKNFYSENAYTNHLSSHKHKTNVRMQKRSENQDEDVGSVMSSTFLVGDRSENASVASTIDEDTEEESSPATNGKKHILPSGAGTATLPLRRSASSAANDLSPHLLSSDHPQTHATSKTAQAKPNGEITKEEALRQCLFCAYLAEGIDQNLDHMQRVHGMFVPERQYLVDLEGLILYLSRKVHIEYQCLHCGRLKWTEDGIKTHMRDLSHCKIAYDTEEQQLDIGEFYDFRSTYSDDMDSEDEEVEEVGSARGGGVKLGAKRTTSSKVEGADGQDELESADDAGWETDSTVSSVPSDEIGALYSDVSKDNIRSRLQRSKTDSRRHHSSDGYHSHAHATPHAVYSDEYELYLPTGRIAGHRSLNKYFRQNLRNYPTPAERLEQRLLTENDEDDGDTTAADRGRGRDRHRQLVSRANGGTGMVGVTDAAKRQTEAVEVRERKREQRHAARQQWRTDLKGNSQKHFRDPLLQ